MDPKYQQGKYILTFLFFRKSRKKHPKTVKVNNNGIRNTLLKKLNSWIFTFIGTPWIWKHKTQGTDQPLSRQFWAEQNIWRIWQMSSSVNIWKCPRKLVTLCILQILSFLGSYNKSFIQFSTALSMQIFKLSSTIFLVAF